MAITCQVKIPKRSVQNGQLQFATHTHLPTQWSQALGIEILNSSTVHLFDFLTIDILCITDNFGHSFDI